MLHIILIEEDAVGKDLLRRIVQIGGSGYHRAHQRSLIGRRGVPLENPHLIVDAPCLGGQRIHKHLEHILRQTPLRTPELLVQRVKTLVVIRNPVQIDVIVRVLLRVDERELFFVNLYHELLVFLTRNEEHPDEGAVAQNLILSRFQRLFVLQCHRRAVRRTQVFLGLQLRIALHENRVEGLRFFELDLNGHLRHGGQCEHQQYCGC